MTEDDFNLREAQIRNELWILVDNYSDLHGPAMAKIFQEFADHANTSLDSLPGEDFDEGKVATDTEVSSLEDKFGAQYEE